MDLIKKLEMKERVTQRIVERAAVSKTGNFISAVRFGWNNYAFVFYIGSISAILAEVFGWIGWISVVVTILFFYYMGKFKQRVDAEQEKRKKLEKKRKAAASS